MGLSNQGRRVRAINRSLAWRARLPQLLLAVLAITTCVPVFGALPGDADHDGDVDLDDFVILKSNFGTAGATWEMGDFDADGDVDLDDFVILKRNFGVYHGDEMNLDCGGGVMMRVVRLPAGTFLMGSPTTELDRESNEGPMHQVTLSQPFYMGVYEVTQAQYQAVVGSNPSYFTSSGLEAPVERVSWHSAVAFCNALSQRTGRAVTLPTEAQWEYACRAGSTTRFYYGDDLNYSLLSNYAWYWDGTYGTHPVGQKTPNAWSLYDMHGNVWEWCADRYGLYASANIVDPQGPQTGSYRVLRGGVWNFTARYCRSAIRLRDGPGITGWGYGFRVVVAPGGLD